MRRQIETSRVVGTWKLIGSKALDTDGKPLSPPYGPKAMGIITLTSGGRMMAVLCDGRSELPNSTTREFSSYAGSYTFDGKILVTRVDATSTPRAAVGSEQVRHIRFDGETLVLMPPPSTVNGVVQQREMFWERLSATPA